MAKCVLSVDLIIEDTYISKNAPNFLNYSCKNAFEVSEIIFYIIPENLKPKFHFLQKLLQENHFFALLEMSRVGTFLCEHVHMSLTEYRTYRKDCRDYVFLTRYTDQQVVLQMRLNMDAELKRAVDANYGELWDRYTVEEALTSIGDIVNETSNPAVYRKEFDGMQQKIDEPIREFITRLKTCSIDCNFVCPYNENHDLTDYHIINRIRSGIYDETLKQEVLQKSETLDTLALTVDYCEHFEAAKKDKETLSNSSGVRISCVNSEF